MGTAPDSPTWYQRFVTVEVDEESELYRVLADERRLAVLSLLKDRQDLTVREVAAELTKTPLTGQELPKVTVELVHRHVPKLEGAGVVAVDSTGDTVRYTGNTVRDEWLLASRTHQEA